MNIVIAVLSKVVVFYRENLDSNVMDFKKSIDGRKILLNV